MKHKISLLLAVIIMGTFCLSVYAYAEPNGTIITPINDTTQKAIEMAEQFALEYETAKLTLSMPEFSYIQRTDDTALLLEKLRYSIEFNRSFNTGIENLQQISFNVLGIAVATYASYCSMVKRVIAPYFRERGITLQGLTPKDIQDFYLEKLKTMSASSVIHYHANIHRALKHAVKLEIKTAELIQFHFPVQHCYGW